MNVRNKNKEKKRKRATYIKNALFSFAFCLYSFFTFAQDSIPEAKDLTEEKELKFQQFFFKALSQKSIGNYQKSIENLESCNQILANDASVFFEFSKNYLLLNKRHLAKEYINRALTKQPDNIWMLKHLVEIYVKGRDFNDAIPIQQKVAAINKKERDLLVRLYLQNKENKKAISLMTIMQKENALSSSLKKLKISLEKRKGKSVVEEKTENTISLIDQFKSDKSFTLLKQIFKKYKADSNILLKYSQEGIVLFPAQPYVYLINAKALNYQKKYKKALVSLNNGIDFVIEDKMEGDFYKEMAISYKGLGNVKEEKKYLEKSKRTKS